MLQVTIHHCIFMVLRNLIIIVVVRRYYTRCMIDVDTSHHEQVLLAGVTIITGICSIYCPIIFISAKVHWALHHSFTLCTGELWLSFGDDTLPIFTCVHTSYFFQILFLKFMHQAIYFYSIIMLSQCFIMINESKFKIRQSLSVSDTTIINFSNHSTKKNSFLIQLLMLQINRK